MTNHHYLVNYWFSPLSIHLSGQPVCVCGLTVWPLDHPVDLGCRPNQICGKGCLSPYLIALRILNIIHVSRLPTCLCFLLILRLLWTDCPKYRILTFSFSGNKLSKNLPANYAQALYFLTKDGPAEITKLSCKRSNVQHGHGDQHPGCSSSTDQSTDLRTAWQG
jgi:hypothetical protein